MAEVFLANSTLAISCVWMEKKGILKVFVTVISHDFTYLGKFLQDYCSFEEIIMRHTVERWYM